MKKILLLSVLFAFVFGLSAQAFAQTKIKTKKYVGQLVTIDAVQLSVIGKSGKIETFSIDEKTAIKKAKKPIQASEIAPEEKVTVKYKTEEGKKTAVSITVTVSKKK